MAARTVLEGQFTTFDGTELFYRTWEPLTDPGSRKALIVLHRGHEHSGRLHDMIERLNLPDFWAFGYDSRGHGKSPGPRGYAEDFSVLVKDLDTFVKTVSRQHGIPVENMAVVANSVAGVLTATWVHDYAPGIRAMVLAAPAFKIKLYIPLALPGLRMMSRFRKNFFISSYVKARFLTHDAEQAEAYASDPLITPDIAVNILLSLNDTAARVVRDAGAIHTPACILSAGSDCVVKNRPQQTFYEGLSSTDKEMHTYPGFYHGVLFEKEREKPLAAAREFILRAFEKEPCAPDLADADKRGHTQEEYDRLRSALPLLKKCGYGIQNFFMGTVGRLSKGIRVGYAAGFDSGLSLDHVYKNRAEGITPLGRWIDYMYLNAIGWKGIRQRKINLEAALDDVIGRLLSRGEPVRIMDIAGGPGRYLTETAKKLEGKDVQIRVRDFDNRNIEEGRNIARDLGVGNVEFKMADAFDKSTFSKKDFSPNILVISGLYELFPDNAMVIRSLEGAVSTLGEEGYIIYTGQPWHPQIEMISMLPNRHGDRWIMRRRTQAELDQLVSMHGFRKTEMKIDRWGIFTVSIAERIDEGAV